MVYRPVFTRRWIPRFRIRFQENFRRNFIQRFKIRYQARLRNTFWNIVDQKKQSMRKSRVR